MKSILKPLLIVCATLFLSACTAKDELKSNILDKIDQAKTTVENKVDTKLTDERSELGQEATSESDKATLKAFDQDKDNDFSSEFNQLNTDLQ